VGGLMTRYKIPSRAARFVRAACATASSQASGG
jgi:hypothetical protein